MKGGPGPPPLQHWGGQGPPGPPGSYSPAKATNSFDCEVGIVSTSGKHSEKSQLKDLKTIIQQLVECDPFKSGAQRPLRSFPNLQRNVFKTLDEKKVKEWMVERFSIISQPVMASLNLVQDSDSSDDDQDMC